jgi:hypothetical protein
MLGPLTEHGVEIAPKMRKASAHPQLLCSPSSLFGFDPDLVVKRTGISWEEKWQEDLFLSCRPPLLES